MANGLVLLPPFDHPDIVAGQGTIGLEIAEAMPDVATVIVGLSGGGLAAGVAAAVKGIRSSARVIGVTMERGAAMKREPRCGRSSASGGISEPCRRARRWHRPGQQADSSHVSGPAR